MPQRILKALKNFVYAGRRVKAGDSFSVKGEDHAKALIGVGRAEPGAGMSVPPSRPAVGRRVESSSPPRSPQSAAEKKPAQKPAQPMRTPPKPGRPAPPPRPAQLPTEPAKPKPQPRPEQPIVEPEPAPLPSPDLPPQPTQRESLDDWPGSVQATRAKMPEK